MAVYEQQPPDRGVWGCALFRVACHKEESPLLLHVYVCVYDDNNLFLLQISGKNDVLEIDTMLMHWLLEHYAAMCLYSFEF